MALINLQNVSLSYSHHPLLDDINLQIQPGEKITLLGRNGAGKSTMMKLINGDIPSDSGSVIREKGLRTALMSQEVPSSLTGTAYDIVAHGIADYDTLIHHLDAAEERKVREQIDRALSLLSLDPQLRFENLSAGMKRRVLLGRSLACQPDILLLDEPTNHLDIDSINWLEEFLQRWSGTIFFVTHDRAFMQNIADRILELDRGRLFDWKCDYTTFLERKEAWLDAEEQQNKLFDKRLAQEEIWIRKGIKARRTRNEGRVRALKKMRAERADRRERQGTVKLELQSAGSSGKMVVETDTLRFAYGDRVIVGGLSTRIMRGDRVGIIGPNGCGKSTLVKLLLGELAPQSGSVRLGTNLEIAYFDQLRVTLDETKTVRENVASGNDIIDFNGAKKHVLGYLQDFLFTPERAASRVSVLSGGEKNRLMLAKLFTRPFNLLVMDEPTNDLDIETLELLEDILLEFDGTLLLVSHDRSFINNVVTSVIAFEGDGAVNEYAGGYDDWIAKRRVAAPAKQEKPAAAERAKPAQKRKLSFKEKKELEAIPGIIEAKELRREELYAQMSDPAFYAANGQAIPGMKAEADAIDAELETLLHRWEELEAVERG